MLWLESRRICLRLRLQAAEIWMFPQLQNAAGYALRQRERERPTQKDTWCAALVGDPDGCRDDRPRMKFNPDPECIKGKGW
jgi:hypothetical protein